MEIIHIGIFVLLCLLLAVLFSFVIHADQSTVSDEVRSLKHTKIFSIQETSTALKKETEYKNTERPIVSS